MVATTRERMTVEEFLKLPEDGVRRSLIHGFIREEGMTIRNRFHSEVTAKITFRLGLWLDSQPRPRGVVLTGEAGIRLSSDVLVGVDVVYVPHDLLAAQPETSTIIHGVPPLIVEILSPSDTQENIHDKLAEYLAAGVSIVWLIDPTDETVRIYRPDQRPTFVNADQELTAEPVLPGFRVAVADLFR
ncbi:Uma2 family endonuclease [Zavarzinella formosa]|uniref:Uma2 family endonuclease n=1 Tax=Zavarzinella formosa TaxID=360055 RepID=UPI00030A0EA5|nr:Uma2 family endonuclease [Zavarzinella formosa]